MLTAGIFLLALAIFALAFVLYWNGWKLIRVLGGLGIILERVANRAAARNGEPPVLTKQDTERMMNTL